MEIEKEDLFKLAILNDLIGGEVHKIPLERILDNNERCKFKNLQKSTNSLSKYFDEKFGFEVSEVFGGFCDQLNQVIDDAIKTIGEIKDKDETV